MERQDSWDSVCATLREGPIPSASLELRQRLEQPLLRATIATLEHVVILNGNHAVVKLDKKFKCLACNTSSYQPCTT